jgi:hypothetical protein
MIARFLVKVWLYVKIRLSHGSTRRLDRLDFLLIYKLSHRLRRVFSVSLILLFFLLFLLLDLILILIIDIITVLFIFFLTKRYRLAFEVLHLSRGPVGIWLGEEAWLVLEIWLLLDNILMVLIVGSRGVAHVLVWHLVT